MKEKAIFKFNNGNGALLCSGCRKIIKEGRKFEYLEWKAMRGEYELEPQYCSECRQNLEDNDDK